MFRGHVYRQGIDQTFLGLKLRPEPAEADLAANKQAKLWKNVLMIRGQGNTSLTKEDYLWAFEKLPQYVPSYFPSSRTTKAPCFIGIPLRLFFNHHGFTIISLSFMNQRNCMNASCFPRIIPVRIKNYL